MTDAEGENERPRKLPVRVRTLRTALSCLVCEITSYLLILERALDEGTLDQDPDTQVREATDMPTDMKEFVLRHGEQQGRLGQRTLYQAHLALVEAGDLWSRNTEVDGDGVVEIIEGTSLRDDFRQVGCAQGDTHHAAVLGYAQDLWHEVMVRCEAHGQRPKGPREIPIPIIAEAIGEARAVRAAEDQDPGFWEAMRDCLQRELAELEKFRRPNQDLVDSRRARLDRDATPAPKVGGSGKVRLHTKRGKLSKPVRRLLAVVIGGNRYGKVRELVGAAGMRSASHVALMQEAELLERDVDGYRVGRHATEALELGHHPDPRWQMR